MAWWAAFATSIIFKVMRWRWWWWRQWWSPTTIIFTLVISFTAVSVWIEVIIKIKQFFFSFSIFILNFCDLLKWSQNDFLSLFKSIRKFFFFGLLFLLVSSQIFAYLHFSIMKHSEWHFSLPLQSLRHVLHLSDSHGRSSMIYSVFGGRHLSDLHGRSLTIYSVFGGRHLSDLQGCCSSTTTTLCSTTTSGSRFKIGNGPFLKRWNKPGQMIKSNLNLMRKILFLKINKI